jgi:integrase
MGRRRRPGRFVPMSNRMKNALRIRVGDRKEGWLFPSERSKTGHLTSIAKGFQALRDRTGVSEKVVPYSARHTYGSYAWKPLGIFSLSPMRWDMRT